MGACVFYFSFEISIACWLLSRPNLHIVSKLTTDVATYRYCTEASNQKSKYAYWKILFYKKALPTIMCWLSYEVEHRRSTRLSLLPSMWAERERRKSRSTLQPLSVSPASRSAPLRLFSATFAHRSAPPDFRRAPLRQLSPEYPELTEDKLLTRFIIKLCND